MKKSVIICIGIIFVASIVIVNFFGMSISIYNKEIPVERIECINKTDEENNVIVSTDYKGRKQINIKFTGPADKISLEGTILQLQFRVYPDDASEKTLSYIGSHKNVEFDKDNSDNYSGMVFFYGEAYFVLTVMSNDGRRIKTEVVINAYKGL